ncbi:MULTISPECIES: hypothetical protein [unclassified Achromobacter]|uniref:hypothetical protein n=1 Tax=unclassified Achromobacter TaxID=2626865 RepID=UPI000B5179E1|nr:MULTISPECIES: hypothetical protein [unclassified Achromobacter]OWT68062.1 hypothetical protein CEY05_28935 [Achromobacter sp. HZ34]OWT69899.1 hypothetical protein CEY04_27765 [Achromobacter sp. HZ28]
MDPITVTFAPFGNEYERFTLDAEIDLYCAERTVTPDPESKVKLYVERAVMRVNGSEVPHELTQAQLEEILADELEERAELAEENRKINERWAA